MFHIYEILDKILLKFKILHPQYCRVLDDPRIDTYYISLNQQNCIVLGGLCDECDNISLYNNIQTNDNIMTLEGLHNFANYNQSMDDFNVLLDLELNKFDGNIDDLILLLIDSVKNYEWFNNREIHK